MSNEEINRKSSLEIKENEKPDVFKDILNYSKTKPNQSNQNNTNSYSNNTGGFGGMSSNNNNSNIGEGNFNPFA